MRNSALLVATALLALAPAFLAAQITTGTISGAVSDSSGAVLPGAKVEITNEGTGLVRDVVTDAAGHYSAPTLPIGKYKVSGSMQGFETEVRTGIELTVGREAVVDMKLPVGAVSQSVEVTGEAPLVQTTEATVSFLVSDQTMRDLPLNDRDMSQLILLNPGVTDSETIGNQAFNGYGRRISISGARGEDNVYLMDGAMIGDFRRHIPAGPSGALLGVENVQEFQVLTNSYSAQYGRSLGGVFNSVSKSGTNNFHGDVYDFLRNQIMDAAKWESNAFSFGVKPPLRRNQFGGTIGGPIKKDKLFFFAGYEGTRERLGLNETPSVFDNNARQGIFPAGQGGNVTVSPLMTPYVNWFPLATPGAVNNGNGTQQFDWTYSQPTNEDYAQGRIDLPNITNNDSAFFRYTQSNSSRSIVAGVAPFPGNLQTDSLGAELLTLSETHIYSPTLLNTLRFHFDRVFPKDTGTEPPPCASSPNVPNCIPVGVFYTPTQIASPQIAPGSGISNGGGGYVTNPSIMISNRFTYQDDANWTKGSHSIQFGGQLERFQLNTSKTNTPGGAWTWGSLQAFLGGTCNNLAGTTVSVPPQCAGANASSPTITTESGYQGAPPADVLQGVPSVRNLCCAGGALPNGFDTFRRGFRMWYFGMYVQDNWRVSQKLTLNIGMRYEPYTVPYEIHNWVDNIRNIYNNNVATVGNPYWLNKSWTDFSPRVGFAYDPFGTGKTSIRGGGGLLYEPNDPNEFYNQMDRLPPLAWDFTITGDGNFPFALNEINANPTLGPGYAVEYGNNPSPHMLQFNTSIQQQLGASDLVSVGYAGSRGMNLVGLANDNAPFAQWDGQSLAVPSTTALLGIPAGTGTVNTNYSNLNFFGPAYSSWYNSLQLTYARRFSKGLQMQVAYTWEKNESNSDSAQVANQVNTGSSSGKYTWNPNAQWSIAGYNLTNTLKANYSYDLPSAKAFSKGWMNTVLGGWQTTGVWTLHSGHPGTISVSVPQALSNLNQPSRGPNNNPTFTGPLVLGSPSNPGGQPFCPNGPGTSSCFYPYYNVNAFITTPCVPNNRGDNLSLPFGNISPTCLGTYELGNVGRNTVIGPGLIQWDPALFKNFTITERTKLQFRLEIFNALNRANFNFPSASLAGATGIASTTAGKITTTIATPRNLQLALKLTW